MSGDTIDYCEAEKLLGDAVHADVPCSCCGPRASTARGQQARKLRLWRLDRAVSYFCVRCGVEGVARDGQAVGMTAAQREAAAWRQAQDRDRDEEKAAYKRALVERLWSESEDIENTWGERYLTSRGIPLPTDIVACKRCLRFHPHCEFLHGIHAPALIVAFETIHQSVPNDPYVDEPVTAIHRIRGKGSGNKEMLGPRTGKAIMLCPWWQVHSELAIAEGLETGLALLARGIGPIWATSAADAIAKFPVIHRIRKLSIFADYDVSGTGLRAAEDCAARWVAAGKAVTIRHPATLGADYAD